MKKAILIYILATLLLMLFLYTGFSKLLDFDAFHRAMLKQPFPHWLAWVLAWLLPCIELIISVCLYFEKTRRKGFYASAFLMTAFTLYIAAVLLHFFRWVPCTCGGVIKYLSWTRHLYFNLFFLGIAFAGALLTSEFPGQRGFVRKRNSYSNA
jgi:putative oxidoreductase